MDVVNLFQAINDQSSALSVSRCLPRCGIRWGDSKSGGTWYSNDIYCVVYIIVLHMFLVLHILVSNCPRQVGAVAAALVRAWVWTLSTSRAMSSRPATIKPAHARYCQGSQLLASHTRNDAPHNATPIALSTTMVNDGPLGVQSFFWVKSL